MKKIKKQKKTPVVILVIILIILVVLILLQIRNSDQIDMYVKKVIKAFEQEDIDHIFLKGYEIKHCYPVTELRSMSDVDILIRKEDREKSDKILKCTA